MASRRQKQFDRKYSSYRKFTATDDVNYSTHSARTSYRSESVTSRSDGRGRSTSSEIVAGSESRSYPVYIAIQDYQPDKEDVEAIPLEQGQIVEVLDKKNSVRWLVRTKARPPRSGWVPGSYFETPTEFYKQRRRTREIENDKELNDEQAAIVKRDQVYHELLRSEEEFVGSLRSCVDDYIKVIDDANVPELVKKNRDQIVGNIPELYNFHANVMLKGLNYYSDDPGKVGQTFVRLEKDFENHVEFYKNYQNALKLVEEPGIKDFFQNLSNKSDAGASTFSDHINEIANRMVQYQNYFKEFVKYSTRANGGSSKSIQKALELVTTIPQRVHDLEYTDNIKQYPGDTSKLGRIIRHDTFQVWEGDSDPQIRYVFLFPNKIMFTDHKPNAYCHVATIRLDRYNIRQHTTDEDTIVLQPQEPGLPSFRMKPRDFETAEYTRKAWLKDIGEEQEAYGRMVLKTLYIIELTDTEEGGLELVDPSWCPDEGGTPRKKIKSPPVISPTGSSTSIYSGGSSSIDWTTTGTTLEMQGTRVTRTQYGFRTLQESSAKMCLKVTGYPLPDITWYKDDVLLSEDERHTFYSDEDGFFAMTIDPVHVTDTGRYTCMATNEYGQASTSAFFRVMKVEKEAAPPAFLSALKDQECREGDVINFECEVEGWPEPELVWMVDDQPLRPSADFKLQYDGQTAKLEIRDAQPDDTGVYSVKIQNEFGTTESKAELFVQPDPDKNHVAPEFQATIEDVECNEGDEIRFKSVITGDPNPEITWLINGIPLSESEKVKFISEDGICILTIKDVTRHFDGIVTCQGANRLGTTSCDARLKVRVPPSPPVFTKPLEDKMAQEKGTVQFEVDVNGWPEPILTFTLAGKELRNAENGVEIVGHDGFYRLTITNLAQDAHDGEIVARAINEHGSAESRARLTVEQEEEESRSAPTFIKDIEDQTVKFGEPAIFETTVRGNPTPEVVWFINGHKMDSSSPGVKIEQLNNHDHKMTIDSAQYAGTVLCRAENVVGRFETKARLVVQAVEKPKKPARFTEKLTDKSEQVDGSVVFEVRVEGEPKPTVTWFLNSIKLEQSDRIEIREFDGSIKIQIKNLKLEDCGELKAVAENSEGKDETTAKLSVNKKPFAPEFDLRPKTITVEKGEEARFEAHAFGIPPPTYSWSINGRKVRDGQDGARVTSSSEFDGASILHIDTATYFSDTQQWTISVVAENSLGADETGAQLVVTPKKESTPAPNTNNQQNEITMETTLISSTSTSSIQIEHNSSSSNIVIQTSQPQENTVLQTTSEVRRTESSTSISSTTPKRRVSFAEDDIKKDIIPVERKASRGSRGSPTETHITSETRVETSESTETSRKSLELAKSPTEVEVSTTSEKTSVEPTKKEASPPKSPTKKAGSPPKSPTKKSEETVEVTTTSEIEKTSVEVEVKSSQDEKPGSPPKSPTKKDETPEAEKPASPIKKSGSPPKSPTKKSEETVEVTTTSEIQKTSVEVEVKSSQEEKPVSPIKSPTKKDKTPEAEKPASPTKKAGSPPKSPTKKSEETVEVTTTSEIEKTSVEVEVKSSQEEKPFSSIKKEPSPPKSPTKKAGSPPKSPTKKSEETVEVTTTSEIEKTSVEVEVKSSQDEKPGSPPKSPTKKDETPEAEKPASPIKKSGSPPKSPTKKSEETVEVTTTSEIQKTSVEVEVKSSQEEKPVSPIKSPTKKDKTPEAEKPASPTKKAGSPPKSPTKKSEETVEVTTTSEIEKTSVEVEVKSGHDEKPGSPIKKEPSPPKSPTKKDKTPEAEKPASPTKKAGSPPKSPIKKSEETIEVTTTSEIQKTSVEVEVESSQEEKPASPIKKEPSPPKSPTKKDKTPEAEKPASPTKKAGSPPKSPTKTSEETVEVTTNSEIEKTSVEVEVKSSQDEKPASPPKSPTKKDKTPEAEKPASPTKKAGSPPKSPTKKTSETTEVTTTSEIEKTTVEVEVKSSQDEKPASPIKKEPSPPKSPTKKDKTPEAEKPASPIKKEPSLPKSPTKKTGSPPKSPTKKSEETVEVTTTSEIQKTTVEVEIESTQDVKSTQPEPADKPASPTKKEASPPKSPTKKAGSPPKSPTKKDKTPEAKPVEEAPASPPKSPTKKAGSPPKSPTKKAASPPKSPTPVVKPPAPKITRDLTTQTVNKTDIAHFEIVVEHATNIKWFLNGVELTQHNPKVSPYLKMTSSNSDVRLTQQTSEPELKTELKILEAPKETKKPEFTDKLRDVEVTKGEKFTVDVIALHSPEYKWFLDGAELQNGVNSVTIVNQENKSSLTIDCAEKSGRITVEASNEVGKSESSGNLKVNPPSTAPIILEGPKSVSIKETETAIFTSMISGFPEPNVKWQINEKFYETTTKSESTYTLEIKSASHLDSGRVKVTAQNSAGSATSEAELTVQPNVVQPKFKSNLTDKICDEGEPLRWNLELEGSAADVTWEIDGVVLKNGENDVQVKDHGDGTYHVTIPEAKVDLDGKTITAKAKNSAGEARTSAKIKVNGANKKPEFIQAPQNHETTLEESVKFSAIVTGSPMPNISWFLNNRKLIQSDEVKVKYVHETGKTSIRIHKPLMEHNGTIRVEAVNIAGKIEATAELKVDRKTEVPKFTTNMDNRQVKEGDDVKYTADVEGYPEPSVEWTLNGKPVKEHPNITVTDTNGEHTIEIKSISPDQAGELSCNATNSVGNKKRDVQLAVKRVGEAPTFFKKFGRSPDYRRRFDNYGCEDGVELKAQDDHVKLLETEESDGSLSLQLRIVTTKMEDKGRITVKAENDFGAADCAASLGVVKGRPMAKPAFQSDIAPINLTEGDTLECKLLITGDPTPFVKWYINNTLVAQTEDTEISNSNGVYTLKIHGVSADMSGKIRCVAYNKAGEVSTEGPLKVVAPIPVEFETSLCDATCREGDTLKLKAVLLGEPEPVVSWYVNGKKLEESQNIKIHSEKGTYTVTIKDITCDYSGQVVCEAVNEYGKATSEATLLVLPRGEPPDFLEWLSNVRARTGTKVVHKVVFTGDPKPTLTWFINNNKIENDKIDYTIVTDDKTSILTINSFNPDVHVGEIICKAENDAGEVSCTANMITFTSDMFSESESEAQAEEFDGDNVTENSDSEMHRTPTPVMAPAFIKRIKDSKTKKGHSAVFECVVPDTKGVCCKWLKDGKEIELIARIRVQTRTGPEGHITQELIIDDVKEEDAGKYTCIVENTAGLDRCEASLTVVENLDRVEVKRVAPEFVLPLQDKTTRTSERVVFECKVVGEPQPSVEWFKDNQKITSSESITIETIEQTQRITINSTQQQNQGKYSCVAQNSEGTSKTEAFLTVQGEAPQFTKHLQDKQISLNEKLILSCSVKGTPQPHVEFYRSSTKIESSSRIAIEHDQSNTHWRLVIDKITQEDISSYKAVAINSVGSSNSNSQVTMKIDAPIFEQGLKNTSVKETEEIQMEVKVGGHPNIDWFKDGNLVNEDSEHNIRKNSATGTFALIVHNANSGHAGRYTAKASNSAGTAESSADVEVTKNVEKPSFVRELTSQKISINETSTFSVEVKGSPAPSVDFFNNGNLITEDSNHSIVKNIETGVFSLTIKSVTSSDAGKYTAIATNTAGSVESNAEVTISQILEKPTFVKELVSTQISINETSNLSVTVKGSPAPVVDFYKDGKLVTEDSNHTIVKNVETGVFTLIIKSVATSDAGKYTATAMNSVGSAESNAEVTLAQGFEKPTFVKELVATEVKVNETATLSVTVKGVPAPNVEWLKDGRFVEIESSNHIIKVDQGNGSFSITINNATTQDSGIYIARATNSVGEAETRANFAVVKDINAPEFVEKLTPIEVKETESLTLSVKVVGKPEPAIQWFKDDTPIHIDGVHIIERSASTGSYTLMIENARQEDVGVYSCRARNEGGDATTSAHFGIIRSMVPPEFTQKLRPLEVEEQATLSLDVTVIGTPAPKVEWFKDDHPVVIDGRHVFTKQDNSGHHSLVINNARIGDVGVYTCKATNEAGEAKTTANMAVQDEIEAPLFVVGLKPIDVEQGKPAELEVRVEGKPEPEVKWFKEGVQVLIDDNHIIQKKEENGKYVLVIKDTNHSDLGKYSCQASNKAGKDETIGEIRIPKYSFEKQNVEEVKPLFIEPLKETFANQGDTVVLECRVNRESHPTVNFFKNGVKIDASRVEVREDGLIRLKIEKADQEDVGAYRCEAVNVAGSADTLAELKIRYASKVEEHVTVENTEELLLEETVIGETATTGDGDHRKGAPEFVELLRSCTVAEKSQAVLKCRVSGEPRPKIKWTREGKEVEMSTRIRAEHKDDGTLTLTIDNVTHNDAGEYRCHAENEFGSAWTEGPIIVTLEGAAKIDGEAPDFIQPVRPAVVQVDGTQRLVIDKAITSDQDEYRCSASNEYGDVWSDVTLTVKETAPAFVQELKALEVKETETAKFECKISGSAADVKWFKDGAEISTDSRIHKESNVDGTQTLVIEKSQTSDQGNYRVEVTNDSGVANSKAPLTVIPGEVLKIKRGLVDTTVNQGTKIILSVEVEGKPKIVKWYKGSESVTSSSHTKLVQITESEYKLEIESGEISDSGSYRVVLSTESLSVESSATLTVTDSLPTFKKGLADQIVPKGSKLVLEVEIDGKPKNVKWYKNGEELKGEDLGDGKYRLVVPDFQEPGDYTVTASNDAGEIDSKAKITAAEGKPEIVSGLIPIIFKNVKWYKNGKEIPDAKAEDKGDGNYQLTIPDAQQDDTADYKVVVSNDAGDADSAAALTFRSIKEKLPLSRFKTKGPVKNVKWYKNGKEIPDAKAEDKGDGEYVLTIPDAQADDDTADYKVVVSNDAGDADSSAALTVKLPAEVPKIVKGLEDQTIPVGAPLKLEIETSGSPKTVKWYKNGREIPGGKADGDNKFSLEIPAAVANDTGDYKVEVSNEAGAANSASKIVVEPKITFLKPLKDQSITEGENADFTLETNTKPRTVKWYKNGQEIKDGAERMSIAQVSDTKFALTIKNAVRDDAAEYRVVLSNTAGDAESAAKLTVNKAKAGICKILKGLQDQIVAKGASLVFEVKIEGEPDEVRWFKDGKAVQGDVEKVDNQTYRFTIKSATPEDAGEYSVEAVNESGKAKSSAKGEVDEKPEIVKGLDDLDIAEGDDERFKVEVSQPVRSVKWYKNGQEIKPNNHLDAKKIGPKKYELVINKAKLDDGAEYKVVLGNAAGECDSSAALTVSKPNILKILDGLKDVDVNEGEPIKLAVKIEGIPKTVKWYKNGQEIAPAGENSKPGIYTFTIPTSQKSDGAAYRVSLANDKGEVYSGSVVHVKAAKPAAPESPASFISPLKDTEVEEGDMLTLQATVAGEPFPDVKWFKDGVELQKDDRVTMRVALDGTATLRIRAAKKSDLGEYKIVASNSKGTVESQCKVTVKDQGETPVKPKFVIPLRNGAALPGEKKEFNVKVRGFPKPALEWFLNGKPLPQDDGRFVVEDMADGNYTLVIKDVREEDFGDLRVVAKNDLGSDETTAQFERAADRGDGSRDDLRYPPRFNVPLWDRRIPTGDPMFIECHVDANPTAEIEWFRDGIKIEHNSHQEIRNTVDGACRLQIIPFDEHDIGVYKCVAINELGQAETQATYQVETHEDVIEEKKREYAPRINPPLEDQSVNGGKAIRLSCKVDAIPRASVVWYKDGLPLRADSRTNIEYAEDGTATLTISDSAESDIGAYRSRDQKEGEEPFFTKGLVDLWADRGDTFTLRCAVKGDPFPDIKWYRNGQLVRSGVEILPDGSCSLTVEKATMSDEGIYRCEAENAHGKAKTQATAHVQMALGKTEKAKIDEGKPPKFILELSDMSISIGGIIDLECKVTGQPMPSVKWSKDGGPLIEDTRFEWSKEESRGCYQLRIKKATLHDEGTYRCVATNENGSATTKSFVRIDDGKGASVVSSVPPRFTLKMGDVRTTEGQPLKLECKVDTSGGLPEMTWYKDGAVVKPSERIQISLSSDGTATLLIPSCVYDDDGIYRVIATNPSGTAQDKGTATVKKLARDGSRRSADRGLPTSGDFDVNKAPKLIEGLENVRVPEKQGFKLRCKFSGEPKPSIKWFKDGERVFPYGRLQLTESPDGVCELIVDSATRQDAGGYRCVAENTYGSARTSGDVNVIRADRTRVPRDLDASMAAGKAPGFTTPLTIRRAKPGDAVTFECLPYGSPFPSIKWLKDGLELFASDKIKMEAAADGTQRLILSDVTFLTEGYYRCVATNEHGTASTKAELVIEGEYRFIMS
ncbi:unnamed protein product [Caenorhabditis angaria]|uniref:Muscle M-line assembly protein unc-89 n=1 Tax=Caenorhabditis angaria TaxID=860376 RepID=A0A9P1MV23_9PELO|nr:unnamed protein product [Caenorhabditis angaria]